MSWFPNKREDKKQMDTITSKQLYDLIISEKLNVKLVTSRYFNMAGAVDIIEKEDFMTDLEKSTHAGRFDIIEWKYDVNINRTVILTADLHDKYAGEYIEVFGTVPIHMSIEQFKEDITKSNNFRGVFSNIEELD